MRSYQPYVVKQGDYLAKLAHTYDFDMMEVWHHPLNAELRAARGSPDILYPGDVLYLPMEQGPGGTEVTAKTTNRYRCRVPRIELELVLHEDRKPVAKADCLARLPGAPTEGEGAAAVPGRTDADGRVRFELPVTWSRVVVEIPDRQLCWLLAVGELDPPTTPSGVEQRLHNLGYLGAYRGPDAIEQATRNFQQDQSLPVTGEADQATQEALAREHGC